MSNFDQLIRFEVANSAVAFRKQAYGMANRPGLLRDLLGLANAAVKGPRYIFLGVEDTVGGDRKILGVSDGAASEVHGLCTDLANGFIDPPLVLRIDQVIVDGAKIVAIVLPECHDPPYLLRRNVSTPMRMGSGWIRQGDHYRRLVRTDLQRIFEEKLLSQHSGTEIRIGFAGRISETVLHMPVMRLDALPSKVANSKWRRMLDAKQLAREASDQEGSRIQRLVHAQQFGHEELYRAEGTTTLVRRLDHTSEDFDAADRHYIYETRAHKLNLMLENLGGSPFERGTLTLDFPRMDGVDIADRLWPKPEGAQTVPDGYPAVEHGLRTIRVQTTVGPIQPQGKVVAFRQPLRLCLREAGIGKTVPVTYGLHGKGLRATVSGALRINIVDG